MHTAYRTLYNAIHGGATMAPTLRAFVSGEVAKDASILKERRKAREARGGGRGKGRGRGGEDTQ